MRFLVHRLDVEHFRWAKRIARKPLHPFVPQNHIHSFTAELAAHGTYARASRPEAGGYGVHSGNRARYRHLRPDAGMACHRSNLDHSAANLRGLAFDEAREHCRGNPGQDDGRIVGLDGVHRHPDGFLRIEDLVSALFFGRQPSLYRTEVDDEVLPFATGDDRRFQLADPVAVPFGAGEHPRGSEARLEYRAGRPCGAAGRRTEGNLNLHQISRGKPIGSCLHSDLSFGILHLLGHALHHVAHELPFFGIEAGAQREAAAARSGQRCCLFHARDDLGPIHFRGEFLEWQPSARQAPPLGGTPSEQGLEVRSETRGENFAPGDLPLFVGPIQAEDAVLLHRPQRSGHGPRSILHPVAYPNPLPEKSPTLLDRTQRTIETWRAHLEGVGPGNRILQIEECGQLFVHPFAISQPYRIVGSLDENPYPPSAARSLDLDPCQFNLSTRRRSPRQSLDVRGEIVARLVKALRVRFFLRNAYSLSKLGDRRKPAAPKRDGSGNRRERPNPGPPRPHPND